MRPGGFARPAENEVYPLLERYTAVDVETPNRNNDSLCSIGIVHMEYGTPVYKREFLVQPQEHFDYFNTRIHGITAKMVREAPLFPEVWREISPFFEGGVLAAHNATFDLGVICKMLARYGLPLPQLSYVCTLQKSRRHLPKEACGSHKLNDLCAGLNIPLEHHHDALDDALACALILEHLIDRFGCDEEDVKPFVYNGIEQRVSREARRRALRELGELAAAHEPGKIEEKYHEALEDWARKHDRYLLDEELRGWLRYVHGLLIRGRIREGEQAELTALSAAAPRRRRSPSPSQRKRSRRRAAQERGAPQAPEAE